MVDNNNSQVLFKQMSVLSCAYKIEVCFDVYVT